MRLDRISVENVLGLRSADLALRTPITLIAGANGAGKSSLADAVSMALLGSPRRVDKKKDMASLVSDGAKRGRATIWSGEEVLGEIKFPNGAHEANLPASAQFLPYLLDASRFASVSADERRQLLFRLTRCRATPDVIEERLLALGCDAKKVGIIKPLLLSGFPGASNDARERATEAKGAWRATTGEQWGEVKGDGWEPALPAQRVDDAELAASQTKLAQVEQDLTDAQEALGGHRATIAANEQRQAKAAELVPVAGLAARREQKLAEDRKRLQEWSEKLRDAEAAAGASSALVCPCCDESLILVDGKLQRHRPGDPAAAARVEEYRGYLESAQRAVDNSHRDLTESQQAVLQIKELKAALGHEVGQDALAVAEQTINELRQQRDGLRAKVEALQEVGRALAERDSVIAKASAHHADITQWLQIGEALAPSGIPAALLAEALAPFNDSMAVAARLARWQPVAITNDMVLTYGGRAYGLLSESERWRVDAVVALAIAQLSELRLVMLDRFDVLDLPSRTQLIRMLMELAKLETIDTVIVCGTLKEPPLLKAPAVSVYWIEKGVIGTPNASQAA